jgi:hypothetical protein
MGERTLGERSSARKKQVKCARTKRKWRRQRSDLGFDLNFLFIGGSGEWDPNGHQGFHWDRKKSQDEV